MLRASQKLDIPNDPSNNTVLTSAIIVVSEACLGHPESQMHELRRVQENESAQQPEKAVRLKHAELPNPWGRTREEDRRRFCPLLGALNRDEPAPVKKLLLLLLLLLGGAAAAAAGWGEAKSCIIPSSMDWSSPREYTGSCTE